MSKPSWRGRPDEPTQPQVANARASWANLSPASSAPARQVHDDWSALLPGQTIPLINEEIHGYDDENRDSDGFRRG